MVILCKLASMMRKGVFEFLACLEKQIWKEKRFALFYKRRFSPAARRNQMKKKCPNCQLVNFSHAEECARCQFNLTEVSSLAENQPKAASFRFKILRRAAVCAAVCLTALLGFYLSLLFTSASLKYDEKKQIEKAIAVLNEKGFSKEVFLLEYLTKFRGNDHWLNASTKFENAYAATNFPIEMMTIYPEFFTVTLDDTERAAVLLHEAQHLKGADEKQAYEFVWLNRKKLGWTKDVYADSVIWRNVRRQTAEYAPNLFICRLNEANDCTE